MTGWKPMCFIAGGLCAAMSLSACGTAQNQLQRVSPDVSISQQRDQLVETVESHKEKRLEQRLGAEIRHDYLASQALFIRQAENANVSAALDHLDSLNVNIDDRLEGAQLVLSEGWDGSTVGEYHAASSYKEAFDGYKHGSTDELFPENPKGVVAVEIPSERFDTVTDRTAFAGTILHEAVHNQVAQLDGDRRESLYDCVRSVGNSEYKPSWWSTTGALNTFISGWMNRYASRNIHEDVASTTTQLLNKRSHRDRELVGPGKIPYDTIRRYGTDSEVQKGFNRIEEKAECLHNYGILFDDEYESIRSAFTESDVDVTKLGYGRRSPSVIEMIPSLMTY